MLKKTLFVVMTASALSIAIPAQAGWFSSDKAAHGCHHEKGPRDGLRELKLSDTQKQQIREVRREQRESFRVKMNVILTPEQRIIAAKHEVKRKAMREERREHHDDKK